MRPDIAKRLAGIGGAELVGAWENARSETAVKALPSSETDSLSIGYALAIGGMATVVDALLDRAFRNKMHETHRERSPEEQATLEKTVEDIMQELGIPTGGEKGDPDMAMDWYKTLNDVLNLRSPFKLRPLNHRMVNHKDEKTVIEMLMAGEVGFGNYRVKLYPEMSYEAAKRLYDAHIAADRGTKQSLPLSFMTWFWEQSVKVANPKTAGEPNAIYAFLRKHMPDVNWAKLINGLCGKEGLIPDGATLGEAMLKLYETGTLNERVLWTSDFGAAIGGAKRRMIIAATMEIGVEMYAFFEGIKLGFIDLKSGVDAITKQTIEWRAQPKYMDMRIIAQCAAASGGIARAAIKGDIFNINYPALAMAMKHLWIYPKAQSEHYDRLISLSQDYRSALFENFTASTGIKIRPTLTVIDGGAKMAKSLDDRLHKAGCQSTRVRVLASRYPAELEPLVALYEKYAPKAEVDDGFQPKFDALCESWYLSRVEDDKQAISDLKRDLAKL